MGSFCNGVDVERLSGLIEGVKKDPGLAKVAFRVVSRWKGGFQAEHSVSTYMMGNQHLDHVKHHAISTDEPAGILGKDSGISPAETLLASLASCLSVGYAANAAAMGINIKELTFEITGHGDLQGFMNLGSVRPALFSHCQDAH